MFLPSAPAIWNSVFSFAFQYPPFSLWSFKAYICYCLPMELLFSALVFLLTQLSLCLLWNFWLLLRFLYRFRIFRSFRFCFRKLYQALLSSSTLHCKNTDRVKHQPNFQPFFYALVLNLKRRKKQGLCTLKAVFLAG